MAESAKNEKWRGRRKKKKVAVLQIFTQDFQLLFNNFEKKKDKQKQKRKTKTKKKKTTGKRTKHAVKIRRSR